MGDEAGRLLLGELASSNATKLKTSISFSFYYLVLSLLVAKPNDFTSVKF